MLGMLVIILTGIRFAADIIVPFILALFLAVVINPVVRLMMRCRVPRVLAISLLDQRDCHAGGGVAGLIRYLAE
jgi:AI-2 transport protein TqsA